MNWIYKTTQQDFDTDEVSLTYHLNDLGNDGWELISIIPPSYGGKFHFFGKSRKYYRKDKLVKENTLAV